MTDARSHRIVFLAHCLLNQNAKVAGIATHPGIFTPLIATLEEAGVGIIQLPCPELMHLGPSRPFGTDTVEQYDTPEYRALCLDIAKSTTDLAASYLKAGYHILCVLGVEGSPSCSVSRAPHLVGQNQSQLQPGSGIFMEILEEQLKSNGIGIPLLGIPESEEAGSLPSAMAQLCSLLAQP